MTSPPSWLLGRVAILAGIPLAALILLRIFDVPIGQPHFLIYRYSPWLEARALLALPAVIVGAIGVGLLHRRLRAAATLSPSVMVVILAGYAALIAWTFFAPPRYVDQHSFNLLSPSHDGAFVIEGRQTGSIRDYLSGEFYDRLQLSPEEMRGRRVLSNPPGMTVLAILSDRTIQRLSWLRNGFIDGFGLGELEDTRQQEQFAAGMLLGLFLTALWGASVLFAYPLCRLWLPPSAALCVAFACVFNPATVNFTPGKDPAQLFFVCAILFGVLSAFMTGRRAWAVLAGVIGTFGLTVGLIHFWIMAIVLGATLWRAWRRQSVGPWVFNVAIPFAAGVVGLLVAAYLALDWNILRTFYQVAVRYAEIQLPIITDPFYWTLVGLPMFLLFVGPLTWAMMAFPRDVQDEGSRVGLALLAFTAAAMTYSYFFANNSETPRLWIPFIPLLLLALSLRRSGFRNDGPAERRLHVLLIALQIAFTAAHWSIMDARESEWRLETGRMWD